MVKIYYINIYTGKKYKNLKKVNKAKKGKDFPLFITKKKFIEITKEFKRGKK